MCTLREGSLPEVADGVEEDHDWGSEVGGWRARKSDQSKHKARLKVLTEEVGCDFARVLRHATDGPQCDVELGDEDNADEDDTEPGAVDTTKCLEGELVGGMALDLPSTTEANVAQADREPAEQGGETGEGQQPHD